MYNIIYKTKEDNFMKRTLTFEESIFCQALATTELLHLLSDSNFLESDYYKNLQFPANNDPLKYI